MSSTSRGPTRRLVAPFLLLVFGLASPLLTASRSAAQEAEPRPCAEGRTRIDGVCCWPGQTWDADHAHCSGAPTCPSTLVEHGEECVARADAVVPALTGTTSTIPEPTVVGSGYARRARRPSSSYVDTTEGWPSLRNVSDVPTHRALIGRGEDEGLIMASLVVFDIGWLLGMIGTGLAEIGGSCQDFSTGSFRTMSCDTWYWSFLPIAGPMVSAIASNNGTHRSGGFSFGFGIPSVILQGIGAIMAIIAFSNETTEIVLQPIQLAPGIAASLLPSAPGSDAGLSFGLTF